MANKTLTIGDSSNLVKIDLTNARNGDHTAGLATTAKDLVGAINELNSNLEHRVPTGNSGAQYSSLADFWTAADSLFNDSDGTYVCVIRCKMVGTWAGSANNAWVRCVCSAQNRLGNGSYDVTGSILIYGISDKVYLGTVTGGISNASNLSVTWKDLTQDTNTWRGIQNNLTSTSTTESLSAAQGKVLNDNMYKVESTNITLSSPSTNLVFPSDNRKMVYFNKTLKICNFYFRLVCTSKATAEYKIGTIPTGYRPKSNHYVSIQPATAGTIMDGVSARVDFRPDGNIYFTAPNLGVGDREFFVSGSYILP